jgi:hypothetical protein
LNDISDLTPGVGERVITAGGTRAGKSALMEWGMRDVQRTRPAAMQILVDTKPRFRAETERGRFNGIRGTRRSAAYRYETWSAGPVVPNSVVVDIWDEFEDWRRMLLLLRGFVNANIKGRERRIVADESLDFTSATRSASTPRTMYFIVLPELAGNAASGLNWVPTDFMGFLRSSSRCARVSTFFTSARTVT